MATAPAAPFTTLPLFATRKDLLDRSDVDLLTQLIVPTDREMVFSPELLRLVVEGEAGLDGEAAQDYTEEERQSIALALQVMDKALADASELVGGYGFTAAQSSPLLARVTSIIALYFLHGHHHIPEHIERQFNVQLKLLEKMASGQIKAGLPTDPVTPEDAIQITSERRRYGAPRPYRNPDQFTPEWGVAGLGVRPELEGDCGVLCD